MSNTYHHSNDDSGPPLGAFSPLLLPLAGVLYLVMTGRLTWHTVHLWLDSPAGVQALAMGWAALCLLGGAVLLFVLHRLRYRRARPLALFLRARSRGLVLGTTPTGPYRLPHAERGHTTLVGLSSFGKSSLVTACVAQDVYRRAGSSIVIDPHGTLVSGIIAQVAGPLRAQRALVLEADHPQYVYPLDPLWCFAGDGREQRVDAAVAAWRAVYGASWSERIEGHLRAAFRALAEAGWTLVEGPRFFTDARFRAYVRGRCTSVASREYLAELEGKPPRQLAEEVAGVLVRLREVTGNPQLRLLLGPLVSDPAYVAYRRAHLPAYPPRAPLDLPQLIGQGVPILASFPHSSLGAQNALAAGLFLALVTDAFLRRDATRAATRGSTARMKEAYVWADELPHYCTEDVLTIFAQTRKFGLRFCAVALSLGGLPERLRSALLGAGTLISFQALAPDAQALAREMFGRAQAAADLRARARPWSEDTRPGRADQLNKTEPDRCWVYRRRRRADGVLVRVLRLRRPADAATEERVQEVVRTASGALYGTKRAEAEAEMRLREEYLAQRLYLCPPSDQPTAEQPLADESVEAQAGSDAAAARGAAGVASAATSAARLDGATEDGADGARPNGRTHPLRSRRREAPAASAASAAAQQPPTADEPGAMPPDETEAQTTPPPSAPAPAPTKRRNRFE